MIPGAFGVGGGSGRQRDFSLVILGMPFWKVHGQSRSVFINGEDGAIEGPCSFLSRKSKINRFRALQCPELAAK